MTQYTSLVDINDLQREIVRFIDNWVRTKKTSVPKSEIVKSLAINGVRDFQVINALAILVRKGYIRRSSASLMTNKASYIQLRTI